MGSDMDVVFLGPDEIIHVRSPLKLQVSFN